MKTYTWSGGWDYLILTYVWGHSVTVTVVAVVLLTRTDGHVKHVTSRPLMPLLYLYSGVTLNCLSSVI